MNKLLHTVFVLQRANISISKKLQLLHRPTIKILRATDRCVNLNVYT